MSKPVTTEFDDLLEMLDQEDLADLAGKVWLTSSVVTQKL